jgi:hypothetical protein
MPPAAAAVVAVCLNLCVACRMSWQRLLSLQVLRWLMSDPQLVYALFTAYDMSIHHDVNAVHDTLQVALEIVKVRGMRHILAVAITCDWLRCWGGRHVCHMCCVANVQVRGV